MGSYRGLYWLDREQKDMRQHTEALDEVTALSPLTSLHVRPFINCVGFRAINGNAVVLPAVYEAMRSVRDVYLDLDELAEAVGSRLARLTGAEYGAVTAGCAASVSLAAAACVAGNDPELMLRLPLDSENAPEILVPGDQRFAYEGALRSVGSNVRTVMDERELLRAFEQHRFALVCLNANLEPHSKLPLPTVAAAAARFAVPVLVDAASCFPQNPDPWLENGADLVAYSGGKFLRGPSSTGLLLGRRDLVRAAWLNSAPHQAFGRAMKVGKDEIIGLVAALEYWFDNVSSKSLESEWYGCLERIERRLAGRDGIWVDYSAPVAPKKVPLLWIFWDSARFGLTGSDLRARLLAGEPRVLLDDIRAQTDAIAIDPFGLRDDEPEMVGDAILKELTQTSGNTRVSTSVRRYDSACADVRGIWDLKLNFLHGVASHQLVLAQRGRLVRGRHHTAYGSGSLRGEISGGELRFTSSHPVGPMRTAYQFRGTIRAAAAEGKVILGAATDAHWGAVFRSQFGEATWSAEKRSMTAE